jgi:hypothetical protein
VIAQVRVHHDGYKMQSYSSVKILDDHDQWGASLVWTPGEELASARLHSSLMAGELRESLMRVGAMPFAQRLSNAVETDLDIALSAALVILKAMHGKLVG